MKYVFLFFGLVIGVFWSQFYSKLDTQFASKLESEFGRLVNSAFSYQEQLRQTAEASAKKPTVRKAVEAQAPANVADAPKVVDATTPKKQVIMYATSWCGYCRKAREYFKSSGVSYIEYDIEKDETAKRMHELLGGGGVPLIVYNGKKMSGFSQKKFVAFYR